LHVGLALVDQSLAWHLVLVVSLPLVVSGKSFFAGRPFQSAAEIFHIVKIPGSTRIDNGDRSSVTS
jgi:hypothetical protein